MSVNHGVGLHPSKSSLPTKEELLAALDRMSGLDDKMRENLREGIIRGGSETVRNLIPPDSKPNENYKDFLKLVFLIVLVLFLIVFFGYKLYKSLVERERRREEKRRQKQQKKKK